MSLAPRSRLRVSANAAGAAAGSPRATLAVVSAGTLLALVAFTSPATTVAASGGDLHAGVSGQTWILGGMSLGLAVALLGLGVVADNAGRRRVLAGGIAGLAVASAIAGAAPSIGVLVAARVLQGVAGAGVLAAGLGLVGHAFPAGAARTRATGMWAATIGAGIAIGPLASAALASAWDWRASYWATALLAGALMSAVPLVGDSRAPRRRPFDALGAGSFAAAMGCVTAGLTLGRDGWGRPGTIALLATAAAALALFVAVERRVHEPLVDLALFRRPLFVASASGALFTGLGLIALMSFLALICQRALGDTPLASAGVLAAWSAPSMVVATQAHRLPARLGSAARLAIGFVLCGAGVAALGSLGGASSSLRLVPGLVVAGIGSGVTNAALGRLAVESVPLERTAMGSGANNTARYLGGAAGIAMTAALVAAGDDRPGPAGLLHGWDLAAWVAAGICALAAVVAFACRRAARTGDRHATPPAVLSGVRFGPDARERLADASRPGRDGALAALESFYFALNQRDAEVLARVWSDDELAQLNNPLGGILRGGRAIVDLYERVFTGRARLEIEFADVVEYVGDEHAVFAGRESGTYTVEGEAPRPVEIRTSRFFRWDPPRGAWTQYHHHGSIDDPHALSEYRAALLG